MLYMTGKIFLYGISVNIVYSESGHNNITHLVVVVAEVAAEVVVVIVALDLL